MHVMKVTASAIVKFPLPIYYPLPPPPQDHYGMCEECPVTCDYCFKDLPSRKNVSHCVCGEGLLVLIHVHVVMAALAMYSYKGMHLISRHAGIWQEAIWYTYVVMLGWNL